ncbi:Uncharacterized protein Fot_21338 [Forsythia ovata]|uniref:Uncharacterized protein n=1 Tax=Forsythia ovata TaxID=205694 RepID=A0ABD1UUP8_9LAMI
MGLFICMPSADLTLSTLGATPLAVLPPRCKTGARVEPFISGVTAVERNKILRPPNIGAGGKHLSRRVCSGLTAPALVRKRGKELCDRNKHNVRGATMRSHTDGRKWR